MNVTNYQQEDINLGHSKNFWIQNLERHERNKRTIRRREIVLGFLKHVIKKNDLLLNLGCGVGAYSYYISKKFNIGGLISLDVSKNSLNAGREHCDIKLPILADAQYLPFKDKTFDIVLTTDVIEHIKGQSQLLAEVSRISKDNGLLFITTSPIKSDFLYPFIRKMKEKRSFGLNIEKGHVSEQHPKELKRNLEKFGFCIIKEKYWNIFHIFSMPKIVNNKVIENLVEKIDNEFGYSHLCTDLCFIARKIEKS